MSRNPGKRVTDRTLTRQAHRAERERLLGERLSHANTQTPLTRRYGVIYADPPWKFAPYSQDTGMDRAPENHYPTMTIDSIRVLDPMAADDAVLFLWRTAPMLLHALSVVAAWGFTYRTEMVWHKPHAGTGFWVRGKHEVLIIAARGHPPAPAPGTQPESCFMAPNEGHSVKPYCVYPIIETLYPNLPKVEFFARGRRKGWDVAYSPEAEQPL